MQTKLAKNQPALLLVAGLFMPGAVFAQGTAAWLAVLIHLSCAGARPASMALMVRRMPARRIA